jgi:uncharacterized protein (DUF1778 family)
MGSRTLMEAAMLGVFEATGSDRNVRSACGNNRLGVHRIHILRGKRMPKSDPAHSNKESRLSIRVDSRRKAVIARAAKQHGRTASDFAREKAYQMAIALLADEGNVELTKKQVATFSKCSIARPQGASRPFGSC